uniref:AsIV-cont00050-ORF1 n=1 Tax=Apophua simplicipes ichnovirus TaxID=1329648 RepID=S5DT04_9VIRU|nr:AsIV-cont00050-ORF1 [Apophua simplicipes ichnovirus]
MCTFLKNTHFYRSATSIMPRVPTLDELRRIDQLVMEIRSYQVLLANFETNEPLPDSQRRARDRTQHTLDCMIAYLAILVDNFDIIPMGADAILRSAK